MKIRRSDREAQQIRLDMTAMIDVVFQLLIFFVMTFKTPIYEGDFGIKMPMASSEPDISLDVLPDPLALHLMADADRNLSAIHLMYGADNLMFERDPANPDGMFEALHNYVLGVVGQATDPSRGDIEAELEIDYDLRYSESIKVIEKISGYKQNDTVIQLIEKINFRDQ